MDYKRIKAPTTTVTHNLMDFCKGTENIYESIAVMGKRANQIGAEIKADLAKKLREFEPTGVEMLEEFRENREQVEISRLFERMPKPTLIAAQEFISGNTYHRNPAKEKNSRNQ